MIERDTVRPPSRDLRIRFADFPEPLLAIFRADLERLSWLLPPWVTDLDASFVETHDDGDQTVIASVIVSTSYRDVTLTVHPLFFSSGATTLERRERLAHELIHAIFGPSHDTARRLINEIAPEGVVRDLALARLREGVEESIQDMSRALCRHPEILAALRLEE